MNFVDNKDRKWSLVLNIGTIKKVKADTGFDFLKHSEAADSPLLLLAGDYVLLADVLYSLCDSQCKERGISVDDFAEGLLGDALDSALNGVSEAVINFTPNPKRRETLTQLWKKIRAIESLELHKAEAQIANLNYGQLSTNSQE